MTLVQVTDHEPSRRQSLAALLRLALPLILSNLFFTLQITVDRVFLSWYDPAASGAAFAAAMLFYAPVMLLSSTAGFTATFVAQYVGARQRHRIAPLVGQSLWFSVVAGVAFLGLAPLSQTLLALAGHEEAILHLEVEYFFCLCFCGLPMTVVAALSGAFAGLNRPGLVVAVNALGCLVNGLLDAVLIFGVGDLPAYGITGAGWATVAGSYASMGLAFVLWRRLSRDLGLRTPAVWRFDGPLLGQFLRFAFPSGVQSGVDVIAWTIFTMFVGRLGGAALSATSIVMVVNALFYVPMLGLAQAVCVQVGQHLGADRPDRAARSTWLGFGLAGSIMTLAGVFVACVPELILAVFRSANFANQEAADLWDQTAALAPGLLWFVALYSFFDSMNLIFAFALRGAGDTRFVSWVTVVCGVVLLIVPGWYLVESGYGIYAVWASATLYIAGLAFSFLARFLWGPWRSLRVIEPAVVLPEESALEDDLVAPVQ
jgi:MATE family multidrug resistance protein